MVPIYLPPLRERREDIPPLARYFLERYSEENRRDAAGADAETLLEMLLRYDWPGNVRELENYIERAVVLADGGPLTPELLAPPGSGERRWRPLKARAAATCDGLIQQLVRARHRRRCPPDGDAATSGWSDGVERELIEQVLQLCDNVQVKAAARLGINRNTLHKKWDQYKLQLDASPGRPTSMARIRIECSVLSAQCSVLSAQCSVLSARVLSTQYSVLSTHCVDLPQRLHAPSSSFCPASMVNLLLRAVRGS